MSEATRADAWIRYRTWLVIAPAFLAPLLLMPFTAILAVAVVSILCYREFARATGFFRHRSLSAIVVVGILLIACTSLDHWYDMFMALTPLTIIVIAAVAVLPDSPHGYLQRVSLASVAFQAALTGHLVLSTFHAGTAATAISRLIDMGIEPYVLRSGLLAIVAQRLARALCPVCKRASTDPRDRFGFAIEQVFVPVGCESCLGTGYHGRLLLAEMITPGVDRLARAILSRRATPILERVARKAGMVGLFERATELVRQGRTSPAESRRVLGFGR